MAKFRFSLELPKQEKINHKIEAASQDFSS